MTTAATYGEDEEAEGGEEAMIGTLKFLRGLAVFVLIVLAGFMWLHAALTGDTWVSELYQMAFVIVPLLIAVAFLTQGIRRGEGRSSD